MTERENAAVRAVPASGSDGNAKSGRANESGTGRGGRKKYATLLEKKKLIDFLIACDLCDAYPLYFSTVTHACIPKGVFGWKGGEFFKKLYSLTKLSYFIIFEDFYYLQFKKFPSPPLQPNTP